MALTLNNPRRLICHYKTKNQRKNVKDKRWSWKFSIVDIETITFLYILLSLLPRKGRNGCRRERQKTAMIDTSLGQTYSELCFFQDSWYMTDYKRESNLTPLRANVSTFWLLFDWLTAWLTGWLTDSTDHGVENYVNMYFLNAHTYSFRHNWFPQFLVYFQRTAASCFGIHN